MEGKELDRSKQAQSAMTGRFIITVDLEPAAIVTDPAAIRRLHEYGERVQQILENHRLPATWAVAEPATSPAVTRLRSSLLRHEIALLGEATWVGGQVARSCFAQELARRVGHAQAADLAITSLVPRDVLVDDHLDLVIRHGITAVRGLVDVEGRSRRPAVPHPLHYGLWEIPGSERLPGRSGWLSRPLSSWRLMRRMDAASRRCGFFHAIVDVPRLAEAGRSALRSFERAIRNVARLAQRSRVRPATLCDAAAELSATPASSPQHSILRRAG